MTWKHKFSVDTEGACVSRNSYETVRLQFEKREDWIRKVRGERLCETVDN